MVAASQRYTNASSPYQRNFSPLPSRVKPTTSATASTKSQVNQSHHSTATEQTALPIPIDISLQTLYISSLSPLLNTLQFQHTFLFHLSTSPSRHLIRYLAVDLRVWNELCENGFLGVLARMRGLRGVRLVVEFVSIERSSFFVLEKEIR